MNSGFTTFAATTLVSTSINHHLTIVTQDSQMSHMPKVWLMNPTFDEVLTTKLIDALPNASLAEVQQHAAAMLEKEVKEQESAI